MSDTLGIGFIGAGAVVQSVHFPTLARLGDRFHVAAVWDIDQDIAAAIAGRVGARAMPDIATLLADPNIDVIAVCTPAALHAEHVIAAMNAGKRAVLCEKPLANNLDDARRIADTARATGVPLIVGSMHLFDPAWAAAREVIDEIAANPVMIRSSIVLPYNDRFERAAYEAIPRPAAPPPTGDRSLRIARNGIMELAIHDLPLVRRFVPADMPVTVTAVETFAPFGFAMTLTAGDRLIDLFAHISNQWKPCWEFEAVSRNTALHIAFTPSFVHAGSAVTRISRGNTTTVHEAADHNGYMGEWMAISDLLSGQPVPLPDVDSFVADVSFAIDIADQACAIIERRIAA